MTIYRLHNNIFEHKEAFVDYRAMRSNSNGLKVWFNEETYSLKDKLKDDWIPVDVTFDASRSAKKGAGLPDLSVWNSSCLAISDRAKEALKPLLNAHGETFPLNNGYHLFHCLTSIGAEAIDPKNSALEIDTSSEDAQLVGTPTKLSINESKVKGVEIFKPAFLSNGFLLCQEAFKSIVNKQKLTGLIFEENLAQIFPVQR